MSLENSGVPAPGTEPAGWTSGIGARLPPARVTWLALCLLGGYGIVHFRGLGLASLLALPILASFADLGFQWVRFPSLRIPDGAIATGVFIALLLPPTAPLLLSGAVAVAAIGLKHTLRYRGRPLVNPAASGVLLGVFLFALAPAWWAVVDLPSEIAMLLLGAAVIARSVPSWRLAPAFLLVYAPFSIVIKVLFAAALAPNVLLLSLLDPATLFFGLFLVSEPRTAPRDPRLHPLYAALVAFGTVFLPLVAPSAGILIALVVVGFGGGMLRIALDLRLGRGIDARATGRRRARSGRRGRATPIGSLRRPDLSWTIRRRVAAGALVLLALGAILLIAQPSTETPSVNLANPSHPGAPGGTSGGTTGGSGLQTMCTSDSSSVPSSTLQALHRELGPSVILSYDPGTGATVFYDPVNHVTVTETDLYEDYGFAEFNGDDFAVSGCSP